MARAPVSKTGCWGFESLLACQFKPWHKKGVAIVWQSAFEFLVQVKGELKKVTWPSRKDTYASTLAVIFLVLAVGVFLWAVDSALSTTIRAILRG
jgi:preprotein translocase subunit SecE